MSTTLSAVVVPFDAPRAFAPLLVLERARLLRLLRSLGPEEWDRPTRCPGWSVLGLSAHLLGDDLAWLSAHRDAHHGTPTPAGLDEPGFIGWLDELQLEWVHAARRLSPRVVVDLLAWTDGHVAAAVGEQDPSALTASVSWASAGAVPLWLDHARELSERWIHRQQILEAIGQPSDLRPDLAEPVLDALRWAYPFRLTAHHRPKGTTIGIGVTGPEVELGWSLVTDGETWRFVSVPEDEPETHLAVTTEQAWRLLTNNYDEDVHGAPVMSGDGDIIRTLLLTRAIVGTPK
jgi:uncharacterized protein (TIGR03083 family)